MQRLSGERSVVRRLSCNVLVTRGSSDNFIAGVGPIPFVFPADHIVFVVNDDCFANDVFDFVSMILVVPTPLNELFQTSRLDDLASIRPRQDLEQSVILRKFVSNVCNSG